MALIACPDCGTEVSDRAPACVKCGAPIAAAPAPAASPAAPPPVFAAPPFPPSESVLFQEGEVSVSTSRFVVGAQTYPMANVSSVKSYAVPPNMTFAVLFILGAAFLGIVAVVQREPVPGVMAVGALIGGILLWRAARTYFSVALTTGAGEVRPVGSYDRAYIERIVGALNQSIVSRG